MNPRGMMDTDPLVPDPLVTFMVTTDNVPYRKAASEVSALLGSPHNVTVVHGKEAVRGVLSFRAPTAFSNEMRQLKLPERVYAIACNVSSDMFSSCGSEADLCQTLESSASCASDWPKALAAHQAVHPVLWSHSADVRFAVSAKRRGQRFKALIDDFKLARVIGGALHERFGWPVDLKRPTLEVSASLNDEGLVLALSLLRRRDSMDCRRPHPGLDPTVAYAMVRSCGDVKAGELVCDPMCGKGSLLFEALAACPTCVAVGMDADPAQVDKVETNRKAAPRAIGSRLSVLHADAASLPLPDSCCAALLCDLPFESSCPRFGHRLDTSRGASLAAVIREFARVLAGHGRRAVILINEANLQALRAAMNADDSDEMGGKGRFIILCERRVALGFTQAVVVVAELCDAQASPAGPAKGVRSLLPWEDRELRRADWAALRMAGRSEMVASNRCDDGAMVELQGRGMAKISIH